MMRLPWRSRATIARDVDAELSFHLEMRVTALVAEGVDAAEAERRARQEFGDLEVTRRYCRDIDERADRATRAADRLSEWRQDARYAWRTLRRQPGFAAVSLLTLALAIGANSAIFSVTRAVLLQPLPYGAPGALVGVYEATVGRLFDRYQLSPPNFFDYRAQQRTLTGLAAYSPGAVTWRTNNADPEILSSVAVSANLFDVLRTGAMVGRTFAAGEDSAGNDLRVVVSYGFWRRALGGDTGRVGTSISLDGQSYTIIGVMPRGFTLGKDEALWIPLALGDAMATPDRSRKQHYLQVIGRLKPGVSADAARADILSISRRLAAEYPEADSRSVATLVPLHEAVAGDLRPALILLQGAAGLVLLIACANLANVGLSRAVSRRRELAVRAALGAGRGRLVRQLLLESVLLALLGGAIGVALAVVATRVLLALNPGTLPAMFTVGGGIDGPVVFFSLAASVGTGVLFGLVPALDAARADPHAALQEGGRGTSGGRGGDRARRTLVVAQVALAVVLLVDAGLLLRSFGELTRVRVGFEPEHVLTAHLSVAGARYDSSAAVNQFYDGVLDAIRRSPGVVAVGATMILPTQGKVFSSLVVDGEPFDPTNLPDVGMTIVRGDYFEAMRIPLKSGRLFSDADKADGPPVVIINATAAQRFFPNGDAVGRRIRLGPDPAAPWNTIVGIVGDVRDEGVDIATKPTVFPTHRQATWWRSLAIVIRTTGDSQAAAGALRGAVRSVDPSIAVGDVRGMDDVVGSSLAARRFALGLASCFAAVALALAAVGIYGVLAYAVTSRTREFGVRLALGATARSVVMLVVGQGLGWSLVGLAIGVAGALAGGRLLNGMLYGVSAVDATAYGWAVLGSLAVVIIACVAPAIRATRVDPLTSMRAE